MDYIGHPRRRRSGGRICRMTPIDLLIALFVVLTVLRGARTGLLAGVFSLVGVVVGASIGSRVAPYLMPEGENPLFGAGITQPSCCGRTTGTPLRRTAHPARVVAPQRFPYTASTGGRSLPLALAPTQRTEEEPHEASWIQGDAGCGAGRRRARGRRRAVAGGVALIEQNASGLGNAYSRARRPSPRTRARSGSTRRG